MPIMCTQASCALHMCCGEKAKVVDDAGFGIMSSLLFGVVYSGLLLVPGMKGLWQAVGRYVLDATIVACTTACVGFWVMTTSARKVPP